MKNKILIVIFMLVFILSLFCYKNHIQRYSSFYNFLILSISAGILLWQIISQNIWNRKRTSIELINAIFTGDMLRTKKEIDKYLRRSENFQKETYEEVIKQISKEDKEKLDESLHIYLNYLEGIALGIKYKVYDEKMLFDYIEPIITQLTRWARPFIEDMRKKFGSDDIYIEIEKLANKWKKRNEKENSQKR